MAKKKEDLPWEGKRTVKKISPAVRKAAAPGKKFAAPAKGKKVDLAQEAAASAAGAEDASVTEELLLEYCPKEILAQFKKAKTPAQRADLLFTLDRGLLKEAKTRYSVLDSFCSKLEAWFVQELANDQTGVTGKVGRVEVKPKEIASVEDWPKFYANIKKKGEFDLLNKAVNQKAIKARWEAGKAVPGVGKFVKRVISLTGVKK